MIEAPRIPVAWAKNCSESKDHGQLHQVRWWDAVSRTSSPGADYSLTAAEASDVILPVNARRKCAEALAIVTMTDSHGTAKPSADHAACMLCCTARCFESTTHRDNEENFRRRWRYAPTGCAYAEYFVIALVEDCYWPESVQTIGLYATWLFGWLVANKETFAAGIVTPDLKVVWFRVSGNWRNHCRWPRLWLIVCWWWRWWRLRRRPLVAPARRHRHSPGTSIYVEIAVLSFVLC